jgi:hypothetical protein
MSAIAPITDGSAAAPGGRPSGVVQPPARLARDAGTSLAAQLAERFAERIGQRLLMPGSRLPSVRECAQRHGVSPSTVVGAYDLLQARGLVEARPQRGFFVREQRPQRVAEPGGGARAPARPAPVDATALIRSMFEAQGGLPAPGMGTLPEDWLDAALLQRALRRVAAGPAEAWLRYGDPAGDASLRGALSRRLADLGIAAGVSQIVSTVGASHALDIVSRTLLQPGDAVLVDEPGWSVEFARLTRQGLRLLPVPRGPEGPDLAVMEALLRAHRPRLYVTVSVLHNPTGFSLSPAAAHQVLKLADAHDLTIVEDDTYAWLAPRTPRAWRSSTPFGARSTSRVSRRSSRRSGGWATSPRRACWPTASSTPSCWARSPPRLRWSRPWPGAWTRAPCDAMPTASSPDSTPPARAPWPWPETPALPSSRRRRVCSAGSKPARTPSGWRRSSWTKAGSPPRARCSTRRPRRAA